MKTILLFLVSTISYASATSVILKSVHVPLYIPSDGDTIISIREIPFVSVSSIYEWQLEALEVPFIPPSGSLWRDKTDANLISLYQIKVGGGQILGTPDMEAVVDISEAKVPDDYPFTVKEVADATIKCIKLMYAETTPSGGKFTIKVISEKTEEVPESE